MGHPNSSVKKLLCACGVFLAIFIAIPATLVSAQSNQACEADINGDGFVDVTDYSILVRNFFRTCQAQPTTRPTATPRPSATPGSSATPRATITPRPSATSRPTATPRPTSGPTLPPVSGDLPCGRFPNANPGCMNVSYQSWFDNVPASAETMSVDYTPRLVHQHYDCAIPQIRTAGHGQSLRQGMKISCQLVRYNHPIPFTGSDSWYRSSNHNPGGGIYEKFNVNMPACQGSKYEGRECKSENIHSVSQTIMNGAYEMRFTPNVNFDGMGGQRHFLSSNWQTGVGYRRSSELTARYWIGECGQYQRVIIPNVDKFHTNNDAIPTVRETIEIPFTTNSDCSATQKKTVVFLDPNQHVTHAGSQTGEVLMEESSHGNKVLRWDTTKTTDGVHSILFINLEGTSRYVAASGIALRFNVQNN